MIKKSQIFGTLIVLLPLIEIACFVVVGRAIGLFPTLLLVVISAIFGFALIRTEGWRYLAEMQRSYEAGKNPQLQGFEASLIFIAGFLLIIPGFFTDFIGLLLLIPQLRKWLIKRMVAKGMVETKTIEGHIYEGEYTKENNDKE